MPSTYNIEINPISIYTCEPESCGFVKNPDTEECLEEVVEDDDPLAVEGLPVLHEPGPADPDDVVVEGTQAHGGPHRGHQEPVVNPANTLQSITSQS